MADANGGSTAAKDIPSTKEQLYICLSGTVNSLFYSLLVALSITVGAHEFARIPFSQIEPALISSLAGIYLPFIYIIAFQFEFATHDVFPRRLQLRAFIRSYYIFVLFLSAFMAGSLICFWNVWRLTGIDFYVLVFFAFIPFYVYLPLFASAYRRLDLLRKEPYSRISSLIPSSLYMIPVILSILGLAAISVAALVFHVVELLPLLSNIALALFLVAILSLGFTVVDVSSSLIFRYFPKLQHFFLCEFNPIRWGLATVVFILCPLSLGGYALTQGNWKLWDAANLSFKVVGVIVIVVFHYIVINLIKYVECYFQTKYSKLEALENSFSWRDFEYYYSRSVKRVFGWLLVATLSMPLLAIFLEINVYLLLGFISLDIMMLFCTAWSIPTPRESNLCPLLFIRKSNDLFKRREVLLPNRRRLFMVRNFGALFLLGLVLIASNGKSEQLSAGVCERIFVKSNKKFGNKKSIKICPEWQKDERLTQAVGLKKISAIEAKALSVLRTLKGNGNCQIGLYRLAALLGMKPFELAKIAQAVAESGNNEDQPYRSEMSSLYNKHVSALASNEQRAFGSILALGIAIVISILLNIRNKIVPNGWWYLFHLFAILLGFLSYSLHNNAKVILDFLYDEKLDVAFNLMSYQSEVYGFAWLSGGYAVLTMYVTLSCYIILRKMRENGLIAENGQLSDVQDNALAEQK